MKKPSLLLLLTTCFVFSGIAQPDSYDLLKYKAPALWQQQSRATYISYLGNSASEGISEIIVNNSQPAARRIDSSFRSEWKRLIGNSAIPNPRKRTTYSGISYAENGAEIVLNNQKSYVQLLVFSLDEKIQSIEIIANDLDAYRKSRDLVFQFLESVESTYKKPG